MTPLQFVGVPGGPELIIVLLVFVVPLAMAYWVYTDATKRGNDKAALWAIGVGVLTLLTFFGGIIAFVVYLWDRD
jgi:hypothetical protein